jgi:FkbM family methyltransferase
MSKRFLKSIARRLGVNLSSTERLGMDLELDLARLTANFPLRTIFDVGGNFGQTALRFVSAFPGSTIYSFEPVPTSFERLVKSVKAYPRVKPVNVAIGDVEGKVAMNVTPAAGCNSIKQVLNATESICVNVETIDGFCIKNSILEIDLLKIDVEGYELQVLKGAQRLLDDGKIRFVFAECVFSPNSETPHTSFFDLHQTLDQAGYCFVNCYAQAFDLRLGCALTNVLYALRSKLPSRVPGRVRNIF